MSGRTNNALTNVSVVNLIKALRPQNVKLELKYMHFSGKQKCRVVYYEFMVVARFIRATTEWQRGSIEEGGN